MQLFIIDFQVDRRGNIKKFDTDSIKNKLSFN